MTKKLRWAELMQHIIQNKSQEILLTVSNISHWTHAVWLLTKKKKKAQQE